MNSIDLDKAWLTGFLEGEASFHLHKIRKNFQWRVGVSQCEQNETLIFATEQILQTLSIPYRIYSFPSKPKPQRMIYVYRKEAVKTLLENLLPFFRSESKRELAQIMLRTMREGATEVDIEEMKSWKSRAYYEKRGGREFNKLPRSEWEKIKERLLKGEYLHKIADDYGVTKQAVWYLKKYFLFPEK